MNSNYIVITFEFFIKPEKNSEKVWALDVTPGFKAWGFSFDPRFKGSQ